jgi:uroporphyrinogen decarboxylase
MTPRERIRLTLAHKEPDRIPLDLGSRSSAIEEQAYDDLKAHLGIKKPSTCFLRSHAVIDREVMDLFGIDTDYVRAVPESAWARDGEDELFIDKWNVPWRKRAGTLYYELDSCPLRGKDPEAVLSEEWKPLLTPELLKEMARIAKDLHENTDRFLITDVVGAGIFERAWYLRGFEDFLVEIMVDKKFAHAFLEKVLLRQMEAYGSIADHIGPFIEGVWITDDVATQDSLMFSPEVYREMVKPYQKRLLDFLRSRNLKAVFHTCGAVHPLIPDLLEIGAEIFHPIQLNAKGMDSAVLKKEFGKDMVFWGGGCDIGVLQFGSVEEVREEVKKRIDDLAPGGGFVFTPTHCIQPHTPPANVMAMIETLRSRGAY